MMKKLKYSSILLWLLILVVAVAAVYFRLKGIGKWPLTIDEYYIIKSSENILKYGLPKWDSGGYYMRGLPQQYLTALLLFLGLKAEIAGRVIPFTTNLIAIPGLYLLARKVASNKLALVVVIIFSLSVWEIEFARFARMYSFFQTIFIWYLYFLIKYLFDKDQSSLKWIWTLSFFSIFVYEASIFLVLLNFIIIVWDKENYTINPNKFLEQIKFPSKLIFTTIIFLIAYLFLSFDFRTFGQTNLLPSDYLQNHSSVGLQNNFRFPVLLIFALPSEYIWSFLFMILVVLNIWMLLKVFRYESSYQKKISVTIIALLSLLNLIGVALAFLAIFFLLNWFDKKDFKLWENNIDGHHKIKYFLSRFFNILIIVLLINFLYWILFAIWSESWYSLFTKAEISGNLSALKVMIKEAVNYPYFYETYALFRDTIPTATYITVALIAITLMISIVSSSKYNFRYKRFVLFTFIFLVISQNILNLTYFDTRYFFFLFPVTLLIVVIGVESIVDSLISRPKINYIVFVTFSAVVLVMSEDFNLNHLVNIDSEEINFRKNFGLPLTVHYYPRYDIKTPAEIVNKEADSLDMIIINEQLPDFYLKRIDYIFRDANSAEFPGEAVLNGKKERWTNANLVYDYKKLHSLIDESNSTVWILLNSMWRFDEINELIQKYEPYLYYKGSDDKTLLFKISKVPSKV